MTRTFFSESKAEQFAKSLKEQGYESVKIWVGRDGFQQTIYTVKWF